VPRRGRPEEGQHKAERQQSGVAVRGAGEEAAEEAVEERRAAVTFAYDLESYSQNFDDGHHYQL
jgi:hypothetical protein